MCKPHKVQTCVCVNQANSNKWQEAQTASGVALTQIAEKVSPCACVWPDLAFPIPATVLHASLVRFEGQSTADVMSLQPRLRWF
jgi:hypothetical protein